MTLRAWTEPYSEHSGRWNFRHAYPNNENRI